jgi:hypothetical protein
VTNVSNVTLARLNFFGAQGWDNHGGSATGTNENGTVTWAGVTTLGVFALGNINNNCVPPAMLSTSNITTTSARLNWSAVPNAISYAVDYKRATTERWTNIATATTATSLDLPGLEPLRTYDWRVRANCNSSSSAYRLVRFTTQNPCSTPAGLTETNITSTSVALNWNPVPNANQYFVQYKQATSTEWITAVSGHTLVTYQLTGLSASTVYDWRVGAYCYGPEPLTLYGSGAAISSFTTTATTSVCNDIYEANNSSNQAKIINPGVTISASVSSTADIDWFKVTMPNSSNAILQVTLSNLPADYDLFVYDKNLRLVGLSTATGLTNETVIQIH